MRRAIVFIHDILISPIAWLLAYWLRFNFETIPSWAHDQAISLLGYVLIAQIITVTANHTYRTIWRFTSLNELIRIAKASVWSVSILLAILFLTRNLNPIPRSIIPCYAILIMCGLSFTRVVRRYWQDRIINAKAITTKNKEPALIVGAGNAGEALARDLQKDLNSKFYPIGFIDDTHSKINREIHGVRVLGTVKQIPNLVRKYQAKQIIVAIPSATDAQMKAILDYCKMSGTSVSKLPKLIDLVSGKVTADALKKVSLEELLGRETFNLDWGSIKSEIQNKTVLITGAGGSIGSEVCKQISKLSPQKIIAVDSCEYNLFRLEQTLAVNNNVNLTLKLIDIKDTIAIKHTFTQYKPEIVFHAAAYKHVPMLQEQLREATCNNIIGTYNVAKTSLENDVEKFVLVSTDKAVAPNNIMGQTKRAAEILCQYFNQQNTTKFITVRFGNVLGSAGSVIPTFKEQIERGGPVTVTHPDTTRFFMTIPEASKLILQAFTLGTGGEIFVLDMGSPIKIQSLAEQMIVLSGKTLDDIPIVFTGLRPGEKLNEDLFYHHEALLHTKHQQIHIATSKTSLPPKAIFEDLLIKLETACNNYDIPEIKKHLDFILIEHHDTQDRNNCISAL
ncbi:MAG: polysaccharide biosynthesis protein [Francisellaceae bacterium]|nr:polysaccharide biosynthesis protein [Francisellaceae bacterium]